MGLSKVAWHQLRHQLRGLRFGRHRRAEDPRVQGGVAWLKAAQWDGAEGHTPESNWYGGAGYGKHQRPDLSNTQTMLDALRDAGVPPEDEAFQRAVAFITRAQNRSESNPHHGPGMTAALCTPLLERANPR